MRVVSLTLIGTCMASPNATYACSCALGWGGVHCETEVNYCENVICQNHGVCEPSPRNYACRCLGDSFSGRHCEVTAQNIVVRGVVAKTFGYIAIIVIVAAAMFIAFLDVLKYGFGVDVAPVRETKKGKGKRRSTIIIRFIYVNQQIVSSSERTV